MKPILNQAYVDDAYESLQQFDVEVRDGELIISSEGEESIKTRINNYQRACEAFRRLCQERVHLIHEAYHGNLYLALAEYPNNLTHESERVNLSLSDYEKLMTEIASKNTMYISTLVDTIYSQFGFDPRRLHALKTRFRIEFAHSESPYPYIVIGWDTNNPQKCRLSRDGHILQNFQEIHTTYELALAA